MKNCVSNTLLPVLDETRFSSQSGVIHRLGLSPDTLRWRRKCRALLAGLLLTSLLSFAQSQTVTVSNLWSISTAAGRSYVTSGSTERGIAVNPVTGHVLLVSRAGTLTVAILDGETGTELGFMNVSGIAGGTFALSLIGVTEDGAIYGGNLSGSATAIPTYRLYRWATEDAAPAQVFTGNPGGAANGRWGDNFDVRGGGTNTQVLIGSDGILAAILAPTDETLSAFAATTLTVGGISAGNLQKGVAFGSNDTFYGKSTQSGQARYISFVLTNGTAALITNYNIAATVAGICIDTNNNLLAGVQTSQSASGHALVVYDLNSGTTPTVIASIPLPTPNIATPNAVGGIDIALGKIVAVDTANGVVAAQIVIITNAIPPALTTQPANQTVLQGGYLIFSVAATGTKPFNYQWYFNETDVLADATNSSLTLSNAQPVNAGNYTVVITNEAGSITSAVATLTVNPSVLSAAMEFLWSAPSGTRPYLAADNNHRGLAYNPLTGNLLIVSRTGSNAVYVLDSETGADKHTLSVVGVTGGTFDINMIGVADDGAVFACNLVTSGSGFKLYRWYTDDAANDPFVAYGPASPDTTMRLGDSFDVRGAGTGTTLLAGARDGGSVVVFTTTDGANFTAAVITVPEASAELSRLGLAFGAGNTYWSKAANGVLRQVAFDLTTSAGTVLRSYTTSEFPATLLPIGVDPVNELLAGVGIGDTPDSLRLFDIANRFVAPVWLDTEFFPTDNANANGTGSVDFGGDKVFALDSNNGLLAMRLTPAPPVITTQPAALTNAIGTSAAFSVLATGYPRGFQWFHDGTGVPGATAATLTISNIAASDAGNYTVVVYNSQDVVQSDPAALHVLPAILAQPTNLTVNAGETATFSVTADGEAPLSYQWLFNGAAMPGQTNSALTLSNARPANAGSYSVLVSNAAGSVVSSDAVLAVNAPLLQVTAQPQSQTVLAGANVSFDVTASGTPPLAYQWRKNGTSLTDATNSTLALNNVQIAAEGGYDVIVSDTSGSATSVVATLLVNVPPSIGNGSSGTPPARDSDNFSLSFQSQAGRAYVIEYKDALDAPGWTELRQVTGTGAEMTITDAAATVPMRFYRVRLL